MAQICFPLDDTNYLAKDVRLFHIGRATGVINATGKDFLTSASGMKTLVGKGYAYLLTGTDEFGGVVFGSDAVETFTHSPADALLDRIDAIIIRYSSLENSCKLVKIEGEPSSFPKGYQPVRNASVYELVLQYVHVNHGISALTNSMIDSQILNEKVCGLAVDTLAKIPTAQYDAQISQWKIENEQAFETWFNTIKGQLSGDVAGKLQVQISDNASQIRSTSDIAVDARDRADTAQEKADRAYSRIKYGTSAPSGGVDGDVYIQLKG